MSNRSELFAVCGAFLCFALPHGVKRTALGIEEASDSFRLWCGLPLLVLGIAGLECMRVTAKHLLAETRPRKGSRYIGPRPRCKSSPWSSSKQSCSCNSSCCSTDPFTSGRVAGYTSCT